MKGNRASKVSEADIHDYLDDRLDKDKRRIVAAALDADPGLMANFTGLKIQKNKLKSLHQKILLEPIPKRLLNVVYKGRKIRTKEQ